jgi:hypothetical protein
VCKQVLKARYGGDLSQLSLGEALLTFLEEVGGMDPATQAVSINHGGIMSRAELEALAVLARATAVAQAAAAAAAAASAAGQAPDQVVAAAAAASAAAQAGFAVAAAREGAPLYFKLVDPITGETGFWMPPAPAALSCASSCIPGLACHTQESAGC